MGLFKNSGKPRRRNSLPQILLVEDSATSLAVVSRYLSERYALIPAKDGETAWDILQSNLNIELVITDIIMPGMTGQQLLVRIRTSKIPRISNLPVIVMTTEDDDADKNLAFLNGANDFLSKPIDALELQARVNVHHKLASTIRELETSRRTLAEQANTDPLTKLKNRRAFFEHSAQQLSLYKRHKTELSVMLLDIDHFKNINDTYGHQAGDEMLKIIAKLLTDKVRAEDIVARLGGEEFVVLLPGTNRLGAAVLAERVRIAMEQEKPVIDGKPIHVTTSVGVATFGAEPVDTMEELLKVADRRLYLAKEHGRNRICVDDEGSTKFTLPADEMEN